MNRACLTAEQYGRSISTVNSRMQQTACNTQQVVVRSSNMDTVQLKVCSRLQHQQNQQHRNSSNSCWGSSSIIGLLSGFFCNHRLPALAVALAAALEPVASLMVASAVVVAIASVTVTATTAVTVQSEASSSSSNSRSNNSGTLVAIK